MNSDSKNMNTHNADSGEEAPERGSSILMWIQGVVGSIGRTTVRFVKNIPSRIQNKYQRYRNEKKRMPRRKTKSKVYVLVGYTTKEHIDRRFAAVKVQQIIRKVMLGFILLFMVIILNNWLNPLGNTDELKQIIGIDKIDDLAQEDPFGEPGATNQIQIITPTGTPTTAVT